MNWLKSTLSPFLSESPHTAAAAADAVPPTTPVRTHKRAATWETPNPAAAAAHKTHPRISSSVLRDSSPLVDALRNSPYQLEKRQKYAYGSEEMECLRLMRESKSRTGRQQRTGGGHLDQSYSLSRSHSLYNSPRRQGGNQSLFDRPCTVKIAPPSGGGTGALQRRRNSFSSRSVSALRNPQSQSQLSMTNPQILTALRDFDEKRLSAKRGNSEFDQMLITANGDTQAKKRRKMGSPADSVDSGISTSSQSQQQQPLANRTIQSEAHLLSSSNPLAGQRSRDAALLASLSASRNWLTDELNRSVVNSLRHEQPPSNHGGGSLHSPSLSRCSTPESLDGANSEMSSAASTARLSYGNSRGHGSSLAHHQSSSGGGGLPNHTTVKILREVSVNTDMSLDAFLGADGSKMTAGRGLQEGSTSAKPPTRKQISLLEKPTTVSSPPPQVDLERDRKLDEDRVNGFLGITPNTNEGSKLPFTGSEKTISGSLSAAVPAAPSASSAFSLNPINPPPASSSSAGSAPVLGFLHQTTAVSSAPAVPLSSQATAPGTQNPLESSATSVNGACSTVGGAPGLFAGASSALGGTPSTESGASAALPTVSSFSFTSAGSSVPQASSSGLAVSFGSASSSTATASAAQSKSDAKPSFTSPVDTKKMTLFGGSGLVNASESQKSQPASTAAGFSFGNLSNPAQSSTNSQMLFGNKTESSEAKPQFQFASSSSQPAKTEAPKFSGFGSLNATTSSSLSFRGGGSSSPVTSASRTSAPKVSSSGFSSTVEKPPASSAPAPSFAFGSTATASTPGTGLFGSTNQNAVKTPNTVASTSAGQNSPSGGLVFGQGSSASNVSSVAPFSFGGGSAVKATAAEATKPSFVFGGASLSSSTSTTSSTATAAPIFGGLSSNQKPAAPGGGTSSVAAPSFNFASTTSSGGSTFGPTTTAAAGPTFGSTTSGGLNFGGASAPTTAGNTFGSTTSGGFNFGSTTSSGTGFGSNTSSATSAPSIFGNSAASTTASGFPAAAASSAFGGSTFGSSASSTFGSSTFGSSSAAPAANQSSGTFGSSGFGSGGSGFAFGATTSTPSTGIVFGATQSNPGFGSNPAPSGGAFGASSGSSGSLFGAAASAGKSFGAQSTSAPAFGGGFGTSSSTPSFGSAFGQAATTSSSSSGSAAAPSFNFGAAASNPTPTPSFNFGGASTNPSATTAPFGTASPVFGSPAAANSPGQAAAAAGFAVGSNSSDSSLPNRRIIRTANRRGAPRKK